MVRRERSVEPYSAWLIEHNLTKAASDNGRPARPEIEHLIDLAASHCQTTKRRDWIILDDPDTLSTLPAHDGRQAGAASLVALYTDRAHGAPATECAAVLESLRTLLRAFGYAAERRPPERELASWLREVSAAPEDVELAGVVVLDDRSAASAVPAQPLSDRVVRGDWSVLRPLAPHRLAVPELPDTERFRRLGVCGSCRPLGRCRLGLVTRIEADGSLAGTLTFQDDYAGGGGVAHGGFLATVFDDILSRVAAVGVFAAMTGTLTVRYLGPVQTGIRLAVAARIESIDGRKRLVSGELTDGRGTVLARGSGTWIEVSALPEPGAS